MFKTILKDLIDNDCLGSQKILADKTGISKSTINNWLVNSKNPNSKQLETLANCFGVTTDYLLGREGYASKNEIEKRKELRPSTLQLVKASEPLNDMGIAVVIGYIARLIEENPEFVKIRRHS